MPPPSVELLNSAVRRGPFRVAVIDFDGTLSLVREGWSRVMADIGVELTGDPADADRLELEMLRLSGKPSIAQMRKLAELVAAKGKASPTPEELLKGFLRRLFATSDDRKRRLADGTDPPGAWAVPGAHALLDELQARGVALVLASGTDRKHVVEEAELLRLTGYFGEHVYAPDGDLAAFDKREVIGSLLSELGVPGEQLLGFGDGYAETVEVKRAGGVAVGVASRAAGLPGVNAMKRDMLAGLDADLIVPDYRDAAAVVAWLFGEAA